jgi:pimeloyl-ACP methyl ester carboxylesterase
VTRSVAAALAILGLLCAAPVGDARSHRHHHHYRVVQRNAVIFVHGFSGSGAQFESQKLRFTSNGYPDNYVTVLEYDSTTATTPQAEQQIFTSLDHLIAHMKAITHRRQVDLIGHSLGTKLMQDYLNSSPQRAANVAHYVNVDGQTANSPPGGVRTLALWATKGPTAATPNRSIKGAKNVTISDTTHVQCATDARSFWWMYKFFTGKAPRTTQIVPQKGRITISGRAVNFPQNTGLAGATVQVWPINQATGHRTSTTPIASQIVGSSGNWGPVPVQSGLRYELTLVRTDNPGAPTHHFYYEPFIRSDHLIRLLESDPVRQLGGLTTPDMAALVIIRYKELWGDQGAENDILTLNGVNLCNATTCPVSKLVNALFAADFDHDQTLDSGETWPPYQAIMFVSSFDLFMPAQTPPTGEVTLTLKSRGQGPVRTLTFPNFPATTDVVTAQLNDFEQTATRPAKSTHRAKCTAHHRRRAKCRHRRVTRRDRV